jgi:N-acetyl-anhydromuramyl-L-alanine amidase AmpD
MIGGLAAQAADQQYLIKPGDSLYSIARKHGITITALAERNGLGKTAHLYAGKRLIIPSKGTSSSKSSASASTSTTIPSSVQKAIDTTRVESGRWKYIVIHHSGVQIGSPKSMDRYHREERRMENGLAYHFVIGNGQGMRDGEVAVGRRWTKQLDGGHLASESQNHIALGICLVGNFDRQTPTTRQMQSLRALTKALMKRCKLSSSAVKTHREINVVNTRCPGAKFNAKAFRSSL